MRARTTLLLGLLAACGSSEEAFIGELTAPVVYGADDRLEVYAHPDDGLRDIATDSIVALIPTARMNPESDGSYSIFAFSLKDDRGLCDDQPFGNQPVAASCSGALIADDLVLTAGHCISEQRPCTNFNYVFNYHLDAPNTLAPIREEDVYSCERVVLDSDSEGGQLTPDFAVIQLDRPVEGARQPVTLRPATPLVEGEPIAMIGFGSGLPAKIDSGAMVADPRTNTRDYFVVNLDAFEGHSGSATFDSENRLAGILLGGRVPDYVPAPDEACVRANVYADADAGEIVHNVGVIIDALCDASILGDEACEDDACDGSPCGQPSVPDGGGGGGAVASDSSGCSAGGASPTPGLLWALLVFFVAVRRVRPTNA